jgi:hypothetical protein
MPATTTTTTTTTTTLGGVTTTTTVTTTISDSVAPAAAALPPSPEPLPSTYGRAGKCILNKLTDTPPSAFPDSLKDIEEGKAWLSEALGAPVASYSLHPCDEGQLGLTVLVNDIVYDPPAPGKPGSVALKLHAQAAESRGFGSAMGAYNKELFFYMDIQKQIPLRTPEALAIWTDGTPLDVFPQNVEYFCLMMAHLGDEGWETYGVVDPPSYEELESMMPSLIKLHSARQHAHISRSATRVLGRAPRCRPRACMHGAPTD